MNARVHGVLSPIQQAEREDAISDWLEAHHLPDDIAGPLAETAVTIEALDQFARAVSGPPLEAVLRWAAAGASVHALASEVQEAAMRISGLVLSIKGFIAHGSGHRRRAGRSASGLSNTVDVLKSKARSKSVAITVTVEPNLPKVLGLRRRAESNLGESDRQRARRGGSGRTRRDHREPRAPARRGAHHRQRHRDRAGDSAAHVRTVFHDQAGRAGHRPGPRHRAASGDSQRRRHQRRVSSGTHRFQRLAAARRGRGRPERRREQAGHPRGRRRCAGAGGGPARSAFTVPGDITSSSAPRRARRRSRR